MSVGTKDPSYTFERYNNVNKSSGIATSSQMTPIHAPNRPIHGTEVQSVNPQLPTALVHTLVASRPASSPDRPDSPTSAVVKMTTTYSPLHM